MNTTFSQAHEAFEKTSNFDWGNVLSVAATGLPKEALAKITGSGTTANKLVSLAVTGNPNAISTKKKVTTNTAATTENKTLTTPEDAAGTNATQNNKTKMYIIVGVVILVVIGVLIYFKNKA